MTVSPKFEIREHQADEYTTTSRGLVIPDHNFVLAALSQVTANQIVGVAKAVELSAGEVLYENDDAIDYIYFPVNSIVSAAGILEDGSSVEIFMTGREGVVGLPALIGGGRSIHWTRVSIGGNALRVATPVLRDLFHRNSEITEQIMRAYRRLFTQICQRSVCNVRHTLLQRLSTWLLMVVDRIESLELPFTQEQIANRISVRRAGVSVAASTLQAMHAISYHRGRIVITDRLVIEHNACECYEILSQDFRSGEKDLPTRPRLLGPAARPFRFPKEHSNK